MLENSIKFDIFLKNQLIVQREYYDFKVFKYVVLSFLKNGIHVDEVIASAPLEGIKNYNVNDQDTSAGNTMSETMLAQLPLMEEIHRTYPKVKITINDYFRNLLDYKTDDWLFRCGEWIHPSSGARYDLDKQAHIKLLAEQGKKIAIVYGIDKPHLYYDVDDTVNVMMSDLTINVQRPPFKDKYTNVENVLFYFAPDLPQMQVKQAHELAKWIHIPDNKFIQEKMLDLRKPMRSLEQSRTRHSFYERAIIPCIYPTTHRKVFQGHKPTRMFLGEHDDWFYKNYFDTRTYQMVNSDFRNFFKAIDPMYLNIARTGFKLYKLIYKIGPISKFESLEIL
jgi:hypothetical protein